MKGIILAGGLGTRLYPITLSTSKQLLPIYDKPLIYYPLSVLMLAGIRDILIITTPSDQTKFQSLLGDGSRFGVNFSYISQHSPDGIAQAFILGKSFIGSDSVCLILGDNVYYGHNLTEMLNEGVRNSYEDNKATIFGYYVDDPQRYGVIEFDSKGNPVSIKEKPKKAKSNYAVTGLYFYPNNVLQKVLKVKPSNRGEFEITTLNQMYLRDKSLKVEIMGRGFTWLDTGTPDSMLEASTIVKTIEKRQGLKVACLEEIAFKKGYISKQQLNEIINKLGNVEYSQYLLKILKNKKL